MLGRFQSKSFMLPIAESATILASVYFCLKVSPILILPHDHTVQLPKSMQMKDVKVLPIK